MTLKVKSATLISPLLHPRFGGPPEVVRLHSLGLSDSIQVNVCGVSELTDLDEIRNRYPNLRSYPPRFPKVWGFAPDLRQYLEQRDKSDVLHAHMLWDYPVYAAAKSASRSRRPFVITPHGSLVGKWRYSGLKKRIYSNLILKQTLQSCSVLHVLNAQEEEACREFGVTQPIRVIPNGLPLGVVRGIYSRDLADEHSPEIRGRRIATYLGRLAPEKGLELLLRAWAANRVFARQSDWLLVLAGPDYRGYKSTLSSLVTSLGISDLVAFVGQVGSELKFSFLHGSSLFLLPSHGEGFSMALLEAAATHTPALYTTKCNFPELARNGGGWEVLDTERSVTESLRSILSLSDAELDATGKLGRELVEKCYTLERVCFELLQMYNSLL